MKIAFCLLALLASTALGVNTLTGISALAFVAKYTNMSTKALSTCQMNATATFAGTITSGDSVEIWLFGQSASTGLTIGDHGMYFYCTIGSSSSCGASFLDVTTAGTVASSALPTTWAGTANSTSGTVSLTSAATTATTGSIVFQFTNVGYGSFDEGWNTTYKAKATAALAGVYSYYRVTDAGSPVGALTATPALKVLSASALTGYGTTCTFLIYNASSSATALATLGGIAYLAFF